MILLQAIHSALLTDNFSKIKPDKSGNAIAIVELKTQNRVAIYKRGIAIRIGWGKMTPKRVKFSVYFPFLTTLGRSFRDLRNKAREMIEFPNGGSDKEEVIREILEASDIPGDSLEEEFRKLESSDEKSLPPS